MSGFCGWIGNRGIDNTNEVIYTMCDTLTGKEKTNFYQDKYFNIGSKGYMFKKDNYIIAFNGVIYNNDEVKSELGNMLLDDIQLVLYAYIAWKEKCVEHFVGVFSFVIYNSDDGKIFLCKDHLGIKPLFYTIADDIFIFSTEIKCLLKFPDVKPCIDKDGICQLFGLGPAKVPGKCVFKDIFEMNSGSYAIYDIFNREFNQYEYWSLHTVEHTDDIVTTKRKVKELLTNSINQQMNCDMSIGTMLSGGIDSSIITKVACDKYKEKLNTFSVDYIDNSINFKSSKFQPDRDNKYIDIMKDKYEFEHKYITLSTDELIDSLKESMKARDLPGMADVDSSLLVFCKYIKNDVDVVLSGEFADEIFGGYPWFYDKLDILMFPWSKNIEVRQNILNKDFNIDLHTYLNNVYNQAISNVDFNDSQIKKIMYLNIYWFGKTLIDRTVMMSLKADLDVRVPFTDYRLVEYVWNIPWEMKCVNNREKGLLRESFLNDLPDEVIFRKKSPYPKTYDNKYVNKLKVILIDILNDLDEPINKLVDRKEIINILDNLDDVFQMPWFGQLMTGPQFVAYLIQVNMWLKEYNIIIEI